MDAVSDEVIEEASWVLEALSALSDMLDGALGVDWLAGWLNRWKPVDAG